MAHSNTAARRTSMINLCAFPAQRELIDRACAASQIQVFKYLPNNVPIFDGTDNLHLSLTMWAF